MRTYARISPRNKMLETLIKPRKNKDMQGYKKICKEKLKYSWCATAIYLRSCANMRRVPDFTRIFKGSREVKGQI